MPSKFPLVLKINYDDHINREIYKVPLMTNLVNMIVKRTQTRHEAKGGVEKKILTSRNTSQHKMSKPANL